MSLHQFRVFASVAKNRSITKASVELNSSQSALSQHLKNLQGQFGILLQKNGRRIELTENGRLLLDDIEPILSRLAAIEKKYSRKSLTPPTERLVIGGSYGPSASVLPSVMTKFRKSHPEVDLNLNTGTSREIMDLVLRARLDIAVIVTAVRSPVLEVEPFRKEMMAVFVSANHPLAKRKTIPLEVFCTLPLVIRAARNWRNRTEQLLRSLSAQGHKPTVVMRCEYPDSVKIAVRDGAGIGILYRDVIDSEVVSGAFKIIQVAGLDLTGQSYIVYSKEKPLSSRAGEFLELMRLARDQ